MGTTKTDSDVKSFNNYLQNGLTYISDNTSIHPRDEAGNIIFNEGSVDNPVLIIEPIQALYTVESVINAVKTNFEYFKFPVSITTQDDSETLEQLNAEFEVQLPENDIIYARYKPSSDFIMPYGNRYLGIDFDEVFDGIPQTVKNFYVITKEIKESGKDLRFRIKITHRAIKPTDVNSSNDPNWLPGGYIYWSVNKEGPDLIPIRAYGDGRGGERSWASSGKAIYSADNIVKNLFSRFRSLLRTSMAYGQEYNNSENYNTKLKYDYLGSGALSDLYVYPEHDKGYFTNDQISIINKIITAWENVIRVGGYSSGLAQDIYTFTKTNKYKKSNEQDARNEIARVLEGSKEFAKNLIKDYNAYLELLKTSTSWGEINVEDGELSVWIDFTIPNSSFDVGERFNISVLTGNKDGHQIVSARSYWVVTDASKNVDTWNRKI
jgi:hypothetical protein